MTQCHPSNYMEEWHFRCCIYLYSSAFKCRWTAYGDLLYHNSRITDTRYLRQKANSPAQYVVYGARESETYIVINKLLCVDFRVENVGWTE